ncbi:hypothetical protein L6452_30085 [Arctium lappa]|uniref:Uncharacterized protein n=1 Tax=Arctium lappa TaxID=4217 RepID=A0ACB8ZIT1_ARCLA|nr:hypothetical protein L6452_30085 [Arctium lappa]
MDALNALQNLPSKKCTLRVTEETKKEINKEEFKVNKERGEEQWEEEGRSLGLSPQTVSSAISSSSLRYLLYDMDCGLRRMPRDKYGGKKSAGSEDRDMEECTYRSCQFKREGHKGLVRDGLY